jgi:hypothetical protein
VLGAPPSSSRHRRRFPNLPTPNPPPYLSPSLLRAPSGYINRCPALYRFHSKLSRLFISSRSGHNPSAATELELHRVSPLHCHRKFVPSFALALRSHCAGFLSWNRPNYKNKSTKTIVGAIKFPYLSSYNSGSPIKITEDFKPTNIQAKIVVVQHNRSYVTSIS